MKPSRQADPSRGSSNHRRDLHGGSRGRHICLFLAQAKALPPREASRKAIASYTDTHHAGDSGENSI